MSRNTKAAIAVLMVVLCAACGGGGAPSLDTAAVVVPPPDTMVTAKPVPKSGDSARTPVLRPPVSPARADSEFLGIVKGKLAHDIPASMRQGERYRVTVRAAVADSEVASLLRSMPEADRARVETTPLSRVTEVLLEGDSGAFAIQASQLNAPHPIGSQGQFTAVGASFPSWEWTVRPLESGPHALRLIVVAHRRAAGADLPPLRQKIADVTVPVSVSVGFVVAQYRGVIIGHLADKIEWYAGGLTAFALFLWRRRSGRGPRTPRRRSRGRPTAGAS
jgi:hypothetical protein